MADTVTQVTTATNSDPNPVANTPEPIGQTQTQANALPTTPATNYGSVDGSVGFIVPEGFEDRDWVKNIQASNNEDKISEMFSQMDHLQKKIGEKNEYKVPGEQSTPEEVQAFYKKMGVPDNHQDYQLKPVEWATEDKELGLAIEKNRPAAFMEDMKQVAKKANLTQVQMQIMLQGHDLAVAKHLKEDAIKTGQTNEALDIDMNAQADKYFGANKQKMIQTARNILHASIPPEFKPQLDKFTNDQLIGVSMIANWMNSRFVREDSFNSRGSQVSPAMSRDDLIKRGKELQASPAYTNQSHPEYAKTVAEVNKIFKATADAR